jgi:hypothetical protein
MRKDERSLFELARLLRRAERGAQLAQESSNDLKPTFGTVVDVDDPDKMGRVKVVLDQTNPDFLTADKFDQGNSQATKTDWIKPDVPFKGLQPPSMVGLRVPVKARNGDANRLSFGTPIYDPDEYTAQGKSRSGGSQDDASQPSADGEMPAQSDMVRLPVFPSGGLPDASAENSGCMVLEQGGPMESDWLCVCMKRKGQYYWVRHVDLAHGHAGEDDGDQKPDTDGDGQDPVKENSVWDYVFPTTHKEMDKESKHGTDPRENPEGGEAKHHGGA